MERFRVLNPKARIISACIHADERAGVHMHINTIWISETTKGVGIGLAETSAIRQQYQNLGIKCGDGLTNNAQNRWRAEMKELLQKTARDHGIEKKDMKNKEKYRGIAAFKTYKDSYCEELEKEYNELEKEHKEIDKKYKKIKKEKEAVEEMAVSDIAKGEWYILKKEFPEVYKSIHTKFINNREKVRNKKNIDKNLIKM